MLKYILESCRRIGFKRNCKYQLTYPKYYLIIYYDLRPYIGDFNCKLTLHFIFINFTLISLFCPNLLQYLT